MSGQMNLQISSSDEQRFCRLCMSSVYELQWLIPREPGERDMMCKIHSLTDVSIVPSEEHNARICARCVQQLEDFDLFRRRCMDSDRQIRNLRMGRQRKQEDTKESHMGSQPQTSTARFGGVFDLLKYCADVTNPGDYRMLYGGYVYRRRTLMSWECEQLTCECLLLVTNEDLTSFVVTGTHTHIKVDTRIEKRKFIKMDHRVCTFLNGLRQQKDSINVRHASTPPITSQMSQLNRVPDVFFMSDGRRVYLTRNETPQLASTSAVSENSVVRLHNQPHRTSLGTLEVINSQRSISRSHIQGNTIRMPLPIPSGCIVGISAQSSTGTSNTLSVMNTPTLPRSSAEQTLKQLNAATSRLSLQQFMCDSTNQLKIAETPKAKLTELLGPIDKSRTGVAKLPATSATATFSDKAKESSVPKKPILTQNDQKSQKKFTDSVQTSKNNSIKEAGEVKKRKSSPSPDLYWMKVDTSVEIASTSKKPNQAFEETTQGTSVRKDPDSALRSSANVKKSTENSEFTTGKSSTSVTAIPPESFYTKHQQEKPSGAAKRKEYAYPKSTNILSTIPKQSIACWNWINLDRSKFPEEKLVTNVSESKQPTEVLKSKATQQNSSFQTRAETPAEPTQAIEKSKSDKATLPSGPRKRGRPLNSARLDQSQLAQPSVPKKRGRPPKTARLDPQLLK